MTVRFSILASAVQCSLPRTLPLSRSATASAPRILPGVGGRASPGTAQQQQRRCLSCLHCPNSGTFAGLPCSGVGRGGQFEAFSLRVLRSLGEIRERSRVTNQFPSGVDAGPLVELTRRAVSGRSGAEMDKLHENSTPSNGSHEYLVGGRYCVLLTGHASDYTQNLYGGYGKMFIDLLGDPDDKWDIYAVVDGQFPPEEELEKYDGFVVTGSRHNAHGSEAWITKLCALLQSLHEKKLNTLGICFGHQVLSRALGGKTGKANVGWEIGLRQIQTTDALTSKLYAVGVPPVFRVLEVHQDQVSEIPPGGELLGSSERTGIEVFAVGNHALGIQGHPEFTEDVVTDLIDTRLSSGILTEEVAKAAKATLTAGQADREVLMQLCKGFLKRRKS